MPHLELLDALPDLVALVGRDGVLLRHGGGQEAGRLRPKPGSDGQNIDAVWPEPVARLVKQLVRRAIADRSSVDAKVRDGDTVYTVRVSAQAPDRAICMIQQFRSTAEEGEGAAPGTAPAFGPHLERRGFLSRFKESISVAALCERPTAVAVIEIDGGNDIARVIEHQVADEVMRQAVQRLATLAAAPTGTEPAWYMGQLREGLLVLVVETSERDFIEALVARLCDSLRQPVAVGGTSFYLTPYAGVAILGQDAAQPKLLLEHARAAANGARRGGLTRVCFFSDTLRLRALARLDIAHELRDAIANRDLQLRYVGRHDLTTGELTAVVGYVRWVHPVRGEVPPTEFLKVAEATGLAAALSRSLLTCIRDDYAALRPTIAAGVRISFGALRHHVLHDDFVDDITRFLADGPVPADVLELRIAERALVGCQSGKLPSLASLGIHLLVDEVGRGLAALDLLARAPICGMQLDRSWVTALRSEAIALRVCRAGIAVASALGLVPIATGVDNAAQRDALLELGCRQGLGDLYGAIAVPQSAPAVTQAAAPTARARRG